MNADDIALCIQIRGVYDGTAVYMLKDGTLVNRFRVEQWGTHLVGYVDRWIEEYGPHTVANNRDLLTTGGTE